MFDVDAGKIQRTIALWIQSGLTWFDKKREVAAAVQARDFIIDGLERQISAQAKTNEHLTSQLFEIRVKLRQVLAEHNERAVHSFCGGQFVVRAGVYICFECHESRLDIEDFETVTVNGSKGVKIYKELLGFQNLFKKMSFYEKGKTAAATSEKAAFVNIVDSLDKIGVNHVNNLDAR